MKQLAVFLQTPKLLQTLNNSMIKVVAAAVLVLLSQFAFAQIGGRGVFQSLSLPPSARTAALGGYQIAVVDDELTLGFQNPALLNKQMEHQMTFNQVDYLADINFGYAGYGFSLDSVTTALAGVQYINYGAFQGADEYGNLTGNVSADEFSLTMGVGRRWKYGLSYGANLKFIYSHLANYFSSGLALDLGATYRSVERQFTASLVVRNLGLQLNSYAGTRENLPLNVQLGISQKLANAPFRFNITMHHLNVPDMRYVNPTTITTDLETGLPVVQKISLADNIMRHFIFGTEILLSKNLHVRVGYNHQMRRELSLTKIKGGVGYSWGFGMRIWRFHIDYARATYHMAGASNYFSATSNLSSWLKKEEVKPDEN
ncbi:type IX secretion system protein PorQ [bacterium]|nr:type IX secretion system protein PorQ [bacterium]